MISDLRHGFRRLCSFVFGLGAVILVAGGCDITGSSEVVSPGFEVTNDLDDRLTDLGGSVSSQLSATQATSLSLVPLAQVDPPTVDGEETVASHLSFNPRGASRVFVGYKIPGSSFGGGLDVLRANQPRRLADVNSVQSQNLDVQEVVTDPDEGAEYIAGAVDPEGSDESPSVLMKVSFSGNSGRVSDVSRQRLRDNVAKSVVNAPDTDSNHDVYVATDGNSVYRFDSGLGSQLRQTVGSSEQSSVAATDDFVFTLTKSGEIWRSGVATAGTPTRTVALDDSGIDPVGIARLQAAQHAGSDEPFLFAALNEGGFRVLSRDGTTVLFSRTEGVYTSVTATPQNDFMFASRKNGTVELYEFEGGFNWTEEPVFTIDTSQLDIVPSDTQVNQVLAVGNILFLANSRVGLLVVAVV